MQGGIKAAGGFDSPFEEGLKGDVTLKGDKGRCYLFPLS